MLSGKTCGEVIVSKAVTASDRYAKLSLAVRVGNLKVPLINV